MSKPASRTPPNTIDIPTTQIVLTRTPQSINIDIDDDEENKKDQRLTSSCVVATFHDGAVSTTSPSSSSSETILVGWRWYHCPSGLLPAATALAAGPKGKSFGDLNTAMCSPIDSLASLVETLQSSEGIFFALSHSSYRVYQREGGAVAGGGAITEEDGADEVSPSPGRSRGGTKDKITSAVAFDFVSGIMKGVVGGELYGE